MKYIAIYRAPLTVIDEWMKKPEAERKAEEQKIQAAWQTWGQSHASMIKESAGLGKNTQVSSAGAAPARNDLMMYTIVEAATPEAAAEIFKGHPHLMIPDATIDIMPSNAMPGM